MAGNVLSKKCNFCEYETNILLTDNQVEMLNNGQLIQNVIPNVSPGDRELFISGICGGCFDKMFQ